MNPRQPAYDKVPNPADDRQMRSKQPILFARFAVETRIFFAS